MATEVQSAETFEIMETGPDLLLNKAIEKGLPVEVLEKLLDLKERFDAEESRKAFGEAMTAAQGEMPTVVAESKNDQTSSKYAKLDAINKAITPVYTRHGFSLTFGEGRADQDGWVRICCECIHSSGHSREYHVDLPRDMAGIAGTVNKTEIHGTGSTLSYGRRYLACMIFNISVGDDDDGQQAGRSEIEQSGRSLAKSIKCASVTLRHRRAIAMMWEAFDSHVEQGGLDDFSDADPSHFSEAAEAWMEIPEEERMAMWTPITKVGGHFRNKERNYISNHFRRIWAGEEETTTPAGGGDE